MASDFAIAQFRFLERLLLVHGHWSYNRIADMIQFFFFKNAAFVYLLFWYQFSTDFSGQNAIEQLYLFTYNLIWTSIPILITATFNRDVPSEMLIANPWLYEVGMKDQTYGRFRFWAEMADAIWQSLVLNFVPIMAAAHSDLDLLGLGTIQVFCCTLVATIHTGLLSLNMNWIHLTSMILSVV